MDLSAVAIKGRGSDIMEVSLSEKATYIAIITALHGRMSKLSSFVEGSSPKAYVTGRALTKRQKAEVSELLSGRYHFSEVVFADEYQKEQEAQDRQPDPIAVHADIVSKDYFDAKSVFVTQTLRSGQRIECEGDIVVVGDVNPGAELIAGGNIAVMGALLGLAHAGATGRSDVVVAANKLCPRQLRINTKAVIFPEDTDGSPSVARLTDSGEITVRQISRK